MDDAAIRKLVEADVAALAGRAANPRATLMALGQKVEAALGEVEAALTEADLRAMDLPEVVETERQKLVKLEGVIAKARQDGRADLEQAAVARLASQKARLTELDREIEGIDAKATDLQALRERLEARQVELAAAIAAAPPDTAGAKADAALLKGATGEARPAAVGPPAVAPARAPLASPAPTASTQKSAPSGAAPKAAAPAGGKGGDALDDAFAALLAAENLSLDDVKLPPRKNVRAPVPAPADDLGIPDLVIVRDDELPDEATAEDRAPLPTAPKKGAAPAPAAKGAAAPAPASAKAVPAQVAAKGGAPAAAQARNVAPLAQAAAKGSTAPSPSQPEAPAGKSRAGLWVSLVVLTGGVGAAVAHFVFHLF